MLPADRDFIELIKNKHGVYLRTEDIQQINRFHFEQRNTLKLSNHPVENAKVLTIIGFAALGFFLAPLLGVSAIVGILIGAAIGFRFVGGLDKKPTPKKNFATYSFNSVPQLPQVGGVIPLIYTNRTNNPRGGVRIPGFLLSTRVENQSGAQLLYSLYALGYGKIGGVSDGDLLIDGQPRYTFFSDEIRTVSTDGDKNQRLLADIFPYYSQAVTLTTNNTLGLSIRGRCVGSHYDSTTFLVSDEDYLNFSPSDKYRTYYGTDFRLVAKNDRYYDYDNLLHPKNRVHQLTANTTLTQHNNDPVLAVYNTVFHTTKRCTVIDLNITTVLWAKDKEGGQVVHAMLFDLYLDNTRIVRFYDSNKREIENHRFIRIKNLAFSRHKIELYPLQTAADNLTILDINLNSNNRSEYDTGIDINGRRVLLELTGDYIATRGDDDANDHLTFNKKVQTSSDQAPTARVTTINEIVIHEDLNHSRMTTYPGISLEAVIVRASNRISASPTPSHFIDRGRLGRQHIVSGLCSATGTPTVLNDISKNFLNVGILTSMIVRNLDKRVESGILNANANQLFTVDDLHFETGDRYLVHLPGFLNNFPDIFVDLLISYDGGLGALLPDGLMADFFIDYDSIITSRNFCVNRGYFWDGVIDTQTTLVEWTNKESLASLLFPSRIGGKFGLIPETYTNPVALFNNSNIIENTYVEKSSPQQLLNTVHVTYRDGSDLDLNYVIKDFREKTVTIMKNEVAQGKKQIHAESVKFDSITNDYQAVAVGQMYLNTRIYQNKVIDFSTGLQGFGVREGSLIIVQHITTEIGSEISGFVMATQPYNNGSQQITLSIPLPNNFPANYSAAIKRLNDGSVQSLLSFNTVSNTDIVINGLSAPLQANRDDYTGDYVIIGKDLQHRRYFRVQSLEPQENGEVKITAVLWVPEMFDFSNLTVLL